jgi:hypothetical protein
VTEIDCIHASLAAITEARKLTLELALPGTPYRNQYDVWVYPKNVDVSEPAGVTVTRDWPEAKAALIAGETVLLIPERGALKDTVAMAFQTGFWSPCSA